MVHSLFRRTVMMFVLMTVFFVQHSFAYADDGVKFTDSIVYGQLTPDGKYFLYKDFNISSNFIYKKGIDEVGMGIKFVDCSNLWGQITPDSRWYVYVNNNDEGKMYIKGIDEIGEGTKFIDFSSWGQFTPDSKWFIYSNSNNGNKLYKKGINENGEGIKFTENSNLGQFTPDGKWFFYPNSNDEWKIYKKGIDEVGEGIKFLDVSTPGEITPDSKWLIYQDRTDNYKSYKKLINEAGEAIKITESSAGGQITPDSKWYIYQNSNDDWKVYKKGIDEIGEGIIFTESSAGGQITPDGKWFIYPNSNDEGKIYKKGIDEVGIGTKFIDFSSWGQMTPDSKWYIYPNDNDGYKLYKKLINDTPVFSLPTNLHQQIQSPQQSEVQEVNQGEKIGKYQSGSGIILSATNNNPGTKLEFEVYKVGDALPSFTGSGAGQVTVFFPGVGEYFWRVRVIDELGNASDWVNFTTAPWSYDFVFYEGFEPYPYGYSFANNVPASGVFGGVLGGGIGHSPWTDERYKVDGNKWDIFEAAFQTDWIGGKQEMFDAFEALHLDSFDAFRGGNCYGMALSAAMQYTHSGFIQKYFPAFSARIGTGTMWNNIDTLHVNLDNDWDIYNDTMKTILAFQLMQFGTYQNDKTINHTGALDIFETLKDNPDKTYILNFSWTEKGTWVFSDDVKVGHAVIPYKVESLPEGKRIYFWDNNVEYSKDNEGVSYNQYIEIYNNEKWIAPLYNSKKVKSFDTMSLISLDDKYHGGNKTSVIGFNNTDTLITLDGKVDFLITDSEGRISGFSGGTILEEIPGVNVIVPINATLTGTLENTWKQIYLPKKIPGLTIKVEGKTDEKYNLMIAGGDYYTKVSGVSIGAEQTDIYNSTGTGVSIDFDDSKTGTYGLMTDNFQNTSTGTVFLTGVTVIPQPQKYAYDWSKVLQNNSDAISYTVDSNNDGTYDISSNFSAVPKSIDEKGSISGYVKGNKDTDEKGRKYDDKKGDKGKEKNSGKDDDNDLKGWKIFIDKNGDGRLQEKSEVSTTTDKTGYYKFTNLSKGSYDIVAIPRDDHDTKKESVIKHTVILNNGQNIIHLDFERPPLKGTISGHIEGNKDISMAGWTVFIDKNGDGKLQESSEIFAITNNTGYYKFTNLDEGNYIIREVPQKNWELTKPKANEYNVILKDGQNIRGLDFENRFLRGKNR